MQACADAALQFTCYQLRSVVCSIGEGYDQICLIPLTTNRGSILAVQRHVKDANAELFSHLNL